MDTAEFLAKVSLVQYLSRDALEHLAAQMRVVPLAEAAIIHENGPTDGLYIMKSGTAKVTKSGAADVSEAVLAVLRQGDSFGEIGLIDGLPRTATVTSLTPSECYFLPREAFLAALEEHPEIARGMLASLAGMVRSTDQWIAQLL